VKVAPIAVRTAATPASAIDAALAASVSGKAKKPATPIGQTSGLLYEAPVATSDGDIDAALELLFASA
jgi:hypothetical protein